MAFTEHYNIATEGVRAGHKRLAVLGFGFVTITIEEVGRSGGGPGGTTRLTPPKYKITIRLATKTRWWEHEYEIEKTNHINVIAKLLNGILYTAVKKVYGRFKSAEVINNNKDIVIKAKYNDNKMFKDE